MKNELTKTKYELPLAIALLLLGFALRLIGLSALPLGLNQDEASAGYEAWAILNFGIDRCGNELPLLLASWGSGQNALLSYLAMPFIALLGLSPLSLRLPMALCGCAALLLFWLLARRARGAQAGLWALALLAVNPWHIMSCRWGLESNLLPAFLLGGVYFTCLAREKIWALLPAAALFGLSLYCYGTAFFFLPIFLILAVIWLRRELKALPFCLALGLFAVLALPIGLCQLRNALGLPGMSLFGVSLPALTETRQAATTVFGGGLSSVFENISALFKILLFQTDGLPYNSGSPGGLYYFFGLPLAAVGLFAMQRRRGCDSPMFFALLAALLSCFFIDVNINRANMLWLPLIYFMALGLGFIAERLRYFAVCAACVLAICFSLFWNSYAADFGKEGYSGFFPGLGEAICYVEEREPESAFISYQVNQPYIYALFYTQTPPQEFIDSVDYINPQGAFRWVRSFSHWSFGYAEEAQGQYLILHESEAAGREILASFGEYAVCVGTKSGV